MLKMLTDADVNGDLFKAIRLHESELDVVRVQDVGLRTALDPEILDWAAIQGRIVLTQDRNSMTAHAYRRVAAGLPLPGVFVLRDPEERVGKALEVILIYAHCSQQHEWIDKVEFLHF
jgi:Domain of unknown function (DUF5615)